MPRKAGPERKHFGGEGGMITETQNGVVSYYWKCMYCGWKVGGKYFQNKKARVHLSGDPDLRNGLITEVYQKAPEVVKQEFALLERQKRVEQQQLVASRKRALPGALVNEQDKTQEAKVIAVSKSGRAQRCSG